MIDCLATQAHFADHLRPIFDALPEEQRGRWHGTSRRQFASGRTAAATLQRTGDLVLVAAIMDLRRVCKRRMETTMNGHRPWLDPLLPVILFEHGVGFSFHGGPRAKRAASYAGGAGRDAASILPATNRWVEEANRRSYPGVPSPIVGCPKLDELVRIPKPENKKPVVCISFHWDCRVAPETRWAYPHYAAALRPLMRNSSFELVAHGHPRMEKTWQRIYGKLGVEYIPRFADVARRADVYVNDASSTLYEFAALDRPVVVMDAPWYRRTVHHGLRFWEHADVGIRVDHYNRLPGAVLEALEDHSEQAERRHMAIREVYPYLGRSVPRVLEVFDELASTLVKE